MDRNKVYAWVVTDGPFNHADLCEDPDCEEESSFLVFNATVGNDPEVFAYEMDFPTFNLCYKFYKDVMYSSEPVDVEGWVVSNGEGNL